LIAADGCVTRTNYIALQLNDFELVNLFKNEIGYTGEIREVVRESRSVAYRINFSSKKMAAVLRAYGITTNSQLECAPNGTDVDAFVYGYFDGDGCIHVSSGRSGGLISIVAGEAFCRWLSVHYERGSILAHRSGMWYWRVFSKADFLWFRAKFEKYEFGLVRKREKLIELLIGYKNENCWAKKSRY
jgi:hypothetical protein